MYNNIKMRNPLYPSILIDKQIIKNYNKCLIITAKNNGSTFSSIFEENVDSVFYQELINHYTINELPMWMIRLIPEYYKKFVIFEVEEDALLKFKFITAEPIIYNLKNACILVPNHTWSWFLELVEPFIKDGIKDMYTYTMSDIIYPNSLNNILENIDTSYDIKYWTDINKCRINITDAWLLRDINFSDAKEITISQQRLMDNKCNDYLSDIINKNRYVDASSGIKKHNYNLYYLEDYPNLPINVMINKLLISNYVNIAR